jgi:hypothetical protein
MKTVRLQRGCNIADRCFISPGVTVGGYYFRFFGYVFYDFDFHFASRVSLLLFAFRCSFLLSLYTFSLFAFRFSIFTFRFSKSELFCAFMEFCCLVVKIFNRGGSSAWFRNSGSRGFLFRSQIHLGGFWCR